MQTLTQEVVKQGLSERTLSELQLARLIKGSDQRRYHLVNRALAAGELVRLRRGRYVLASSLREQPANPYALAQAFAAGSYVSFETALAHHGWIPEAVRTIASATPGRKSNSLDHAVFGSYSFHPLALQPGSFMVLVERLQFAGQTALMAQPVRALVDLVCLRKQPWQGLDWLIEGLRIDTDSLRTITSAQIRALREVYSQRRMQDFLTGLAKELGCD